MDNHPIPQDVSHFQFKLIGEMTLKQFGYLGAGLAMAWLFFSLPINFFVRIPIAFIYASTGIILAFVPIEGRPADTMIKNFAKALFAPNQYIYRKESADPVLSALMANTLAGQSVAPKPVVPVTQPDQPGMELFVPSKPEQVTQIPDVSREYTHIQEAPSMDIAQQPIPSSTATVITPQPIQPMIPQEPTNTGQQASMPSGENVEQEQQEINKESDSLTQALQQAKSAELNQPQGSPGYEQAHQKVVELEVQLQQFAVQKQQLEQELVALKQKIARGNPGEVFTPSPASAQQPAPAPNQASSHVHQISKQMGTSVGMPHVPDVPNIITGIVKDSRGNVLPNTLIEVKDAEGNPVRAFKTNQLGQFASATPLLNGKYTVFFDDPSGKHKFDTIEISANGDILLPIEVISIDQREELRKELFG